MADERQQPFAMESDAIGGRLVIIIPHGVSPSHAHVGELRERYPTASVFTESEMDVLMEVPAGDQRDRLVASIDTAKRAFGNRADVAIGLPAGDDHVEGSMRDYLKRKFDRLREAYGEQEAENPKKTINAINREVDSVWNAAKNRG